MNSQTLLAWCSYRTNKIDIADFNTKESYASFNGAKISDSRKTQLFNYLRLICCNILGDSRTLLKEIPNTKLLVSLHQNYYASANMVVFDISKKDQIKETYSLGEVSGGRIIIFLLYLLNNYLFSLGTGYGDITYNSRRGILGAVPLYGKISYHLFNVGSHVSKTNDIVKLIRKSKWHSQYGKHQSYIDTSNLLYSLEEYITALDFNPTGEYVATIDKKGVCLISDVDKNDYSFHLKCQSRMFGGNFEC